MENEFQYDDGGDEYDWSSTTVQLPLLQDAKKWLEDCIQEHKERDTEDEVHLHDVSPLTLNEQQRSIVCLILYTLYNLIESPAHYKPLRLIVSGSGGTGKSYVTMSQVSTLFGVTNVFKEQCYIDNNTNWKLSLPCSGQHST